jgi:hypothetical protein
LQDLTHEMIGDEIDFGTKVVARALQQIKRV